MVAGVIIHPAALPCPRLWGAHISCLLLLSQVQQEGKALRAARGVQAGLGPCLGSEPLWTSASTEGVTLRVRCHSAVPSSLLCLLNAGDSPEVFYPKLSSCSQARFCFNSLFRAEQLSPRMFPGVRSKQGPGLCMSRPGSGGPVCLAQGPEYPRASICSSVRWS